MGVSWLFGVFTALTSSVILGAHGLTDLVGPFRRVGFHFGRGENGLCYTFIMLFYPMPCKIPTVWDFVRFVHKALCDPYKRVLGGQITHYSMWLIANRGQR